MKLLVLMSIVALAWSTSPRRLDSESLYCPEDYFLLGKQCFQAQLDLDQKWEEAREYCKSKNGDLATPKNVTLLQQYLLDLYGEGERFWVGASDIAQEGNWKWISGSPVKREDWMKFQPNNCCGGEDCALLGTSWTPPLNDNSCKNLRNFVCEVPLSG